MPAFLVALMVVVLVVLGLTGVLLLARTMRREDAAVERAPRRSQGEDEPATTTSEED